MTKQTVTINQHIVIDYKSEFSLLDCMEDHQIHVDYNCRGGYCGLCKLHLTTGQVIWVQDSLVTLEQDEILACSCVPNGDIAIETP